MNIRKLLSTIIISIFIMIVLMGLVYDFNITIMNISNILFFVGVAYFFPGIIVISGAGSIFDSSGYLTRRIFLRENKQYFKSFNDYKEYKKIKNASRNINGRGTSVLIIGGVYIGLSLAIGVIT